MVGTHGTPWACRDSSLKALFVTPAERVFLVVAKRRNTAEASALIELDGGALMNAGFQAHYADPLSPGVIGQIVQHELRKTPAAKLRTDVHPLDFPVFAAHQLDSSAAGG